MKTILNLICAVLITTSAFANGNPSKANFLLESTKYDVSMIDVNDLEVFEKTLYDAESENLSFELNDNISFVQIFDTAGNLLYQLPVMSNKLTIGSSLFAHGEYKLGFMLSGTEKIHFTKIMVK